MLSCTFSMFWTTVTSQTSSEKRRTNRHTVKPTVMFGSRAGFAKGSHTLPCFHRIGIQPAQQLLLDSNWVTCAEPAHTAPTRAKKMAVCEPTCCEPALGRKLARGSGSVDDWHPCNFTHSASTRKKCGRLAPR